jgi:hypothetical protein
MYTHRIQCHQIGHQTLAYFRIVLKMPGEIAMGKNTEQFPVGIGDHGGAGAHCRHRFQHVANPSIRCDQRQRVARPHHLMHTHE